jgi:23S rRNA (cytosine1962-C5)-methyltransferase
MMKNIVELLEPQKHFLILNAYSLGFSSLIIENLLAQHKKNLSIGELYLNSKTQQKLPLGVFGRIVKL